MRRNSNKWYRLRYSNMTYHDPNKSRYNGHITLFKTPYNKSGKWDSVIPLYSDKANNYEQALNGFIYDRNYHYTETVNIHKQRGKHGTDTLFSLHRFIIDIDLHEQTSSDIQATMRTIANALKEHNKTNPNKLPMSEIVYSGRGLHIYINFNQESYKLEWIYRMTAQELATAYTSVLEAILEANSIKDNINLDTTKLSPSGVIRRRGSFNPHTQTRVETLHKFKTQYTLQDLFIISGALEVYSERKEDRQKYKRGTSYPKQISNMAIGRVRLIESELPKAIKGQRNNYLFMLYHHLKISDPLNAKARATAYNKSLEQPFSRSELDNIFNYLDKNFYKLRFNADKFRQWLNLPHDYPITTKEKKAHSKKQNELNMQLRDSKVIELIKDTQMTYKEIADLMGLSLRTISNIAKDNNVKRYNK